MTTGLIWSVCKFIVSEEGQGKSTTLHHTLLTPSFLAVML